MTRRPWVRLATGGGTGRKGFAGQIWTNMVDEEIDPSPFT